MFLIPFTHIGRRYQIILTFVYVIIRKTHMEFIVCTYYFVTHLYNNNISMSLLKMFPLRSFFPYFNPPEWRPLYTTRMDFSYTNATCIQYYIVYRHVVQYIIIIYTPIWSLYDLDLLRRTIYYIMRYVYYAYLYTLHLYTSYRFLFFRLNPQFLRRIYNAYVCVCVCVCV